LRQEEIDAGCIVIAKARNQYKAELILPFELPETLEKTARNARRQHQFDSHRYPLSYVSTTPLLERAEYYALNSKSGRTPTKIIVKIDTDTFEALGINVYHTASEFRSYQIPVPQDDEFVLEYRGGHEFPKGIIADVLKLER
jgi:hypothetical protein